MKSFSIQGAEEPTLRVAIYRKLRDGIVSGELKPGMKLQESVIAKELDVSRTPVREAIHRLAEEGKVILTSFKGAEVAPINTVELKDALLIRRDLFGLAALMTCENASDEELLRLEEINEQYLNAIETRNEDQIIRCGMRFFELLYKFSRNEYLILFLGNLNSLIHYKRVEYALNPSNKSIIINGQNRIMKDLKERKLQIIRKDVEDYLEEQENCILIAIRMQEEEKKKQEEQ